MSEAAADHLHELQAATERLVEQVGTLSQALQAVSAVQVRQQETVEQAAELARAAREDVAENAVSRHEFHASVSASATTEAEAREQQQRRLRIFAISAACVAVVISLVALGGVYWTIQHQRIALCTQRNHDAIKNAKLARDYFRPKLAQEQGNPKADPVMVGILQALANQQPEILHCR